MNTIEKNCSTLEQNMQNQIFAGQKYDDKTDKKLKTIFEDLDLSKDKEISQAEIDEYKKYLQLKETNNKNKEELQRAQNKTHAPYAAGIGAGIAGGITGALLNNSILNKILNLTKENNWFNKAFFKKVTTEHYAKFSSKNFCAGDYLYTTIEHVGTPLKKAVVLAGGLLWAGLAGYGVYKLFTKLSGTKDAKKDVEKRQTELNVENKQIEELEKRYSHINEAIKQSKDLAVGEDLGKFWLFACLPTMAQDDIDRENAKKEQNKEYNEKNLENFRNKPDEN